MAIAKLSISYKNYDFSRLDSELLTSKNLKRILTSSELKDYHTSLSDCEIKIGRIDQDLLVHCQTIECLDLSWNTVINLDNHLSYIKLVSLLQSKYKDKSAGIDQLYEEALKNIVYKRGIRQSNMPALWVAGCSFSSALGVASTERWGHLVARKLKLEEVNLAIPGGSIWDSADQILRADIQPEDTVIWGLTSLGRVDFINKNQLRSFSVRQAIDMQRAREYYSPNYFWSNTQCLIAMRQIHQVINYCNKIGVKLFLVNFLDEFWSPFTLEEQENFLDLNSGIDDDTLLPVGLIDYASDNQHPGPLQHQEYAQKIIKFIEEKQLYV